MLIRKELSKSKFGLLPSGFGTITNPDDDAVTVSTVDRFQGDEADIIIASLVIDGKSTTPFVKLRNRMIVLLSRARIASYLIGNIGYFENKPAAHWEITIKLLEHSAKNNIDTPFNFNGPRIGSSLPICCPLHRNESKMLISVPDKLKLGFCKEICDKPLLCSHPCSNLCHWPNVNSHNSKCLIQLDSPCLEHPGKIVCYKIAKGISIEKALSQFRCVEKADILRLCGHTSIVTCAEETDVAKGIRVLPKCTEPAHEPYIFPVCKHTRDCNCSELSNYKENPNSIKPCCELVDYTPPCGHTVQLKCYVVSQQTTQFVCTAKVTINLPRCGHPAIMSCAASRALASWTGISLTTSNVVIEGISYGERDSICKKMVLFKRKCGHALKITCENGFILAKSPRDCNEKEKISSPVCGHLSEVTCHAKHQLETFARILPKVTVIRESMTFNDYFVKQPYLIPACSHEIIFQHKCGHENKISCNRSMLIMNGSKSLLCDRFIKVPNPQCGHQIEVPCHKSTLWKAWPDEFDGSGAWLKLVNEHVLVDDIGAPSAIPDDFNNIIGVCSQPLIMRRSGCGHDERMQCSDGFKLLSTKTDCNASVFARLESCKHSATFTCSEYTAYKEGRISHKCKELTTRKCWNFDVCSETVNDICSKIKVACSKSTPWRCSKNHSLNLKQCSEGVPDKCAECDYLELEGFIDIHESIISDPCAHLDIIFDNLSFFRNQSSENVSLLQLSEKLLESFIDRKITVVTNFSSWVQKQDLESKIKFSPQLVPCFINLDTEKLKQVINFDPKVFLKAKDVGVKVQHWSEGSLRLLCDVMKSEEIVDLLFGFGFSCLPFLNANIPNNKERKNWIAERQREGFDCLQSGNEIIFLHPFSLIAVGKAHFTKTELSNYVNCLDLNGINFQKPCRFMVSEAVFVKGSTMIATNLARDLESLSIIMSTTIAAGIKIQPLWDGISLGLNIEASIAEDLQKILSFSNIRKNVLNPFAGINKLKNVMKSNFSNELILFGSLELFQTKFLDDSKKQLSKYIDKLQHSNDLAHPLLLVALSRKLRREKRVEVAKECIHIFLKLFPTASVWLLESEYIEHTPKMTENKVMSSLDIWNKIKESEGCKSEKMEELLQLTGLKKVKEESVKMFQAALAFQKMSKKDREANTISLNKIFLGNPGSGKTTVARLFAQVLYDSGIRKRNTFIETSAQKLMDGGAEEFRKLVLSAMDGVLFIDEACNLISNIR
jgi:DNA replication protein DnaC